MVAPHLLFFSNDSATAIRITSMTVIQTITAMPFSTAFSSIVPAILTAIAMANNAAESAIMVGPIVF